MPHVQYGETAVASEVGHTRDHTFPRLWLSRRCKITETPSSRARGLSSYASPSHDSELYSWHLPACWPLSSPRPSQAPGPLLVLLSRPAGTLAHAWATRPLNLPWPVVTSNVGS